MSDRALLAFLTVIAVFWAATLAGHRLSSRIDEASDRLATVVSPSIGHLAAARTEVRELEHAIGRHVDGAADRRPVDRTPIDEAMDDLDREVHGYMRAPAFDADHDAPNRVRTRITELERAAARAIAQADLGATDQARATLASEVRPAADRAIAELMEIIEQRASVGRDLALDIKATRALAAALEGGLNVLAAALAALAFMLLRRTLHRQADLAAAQAALVERRADELDAFAGRVAHDLMNPIGAAAMALQLVRRSTHEDRTQQLTDRALASLERSRTLVDDLLRFSRAGARPEPGARCDLRETLEGVVAEQPPSAAHAGISRSIAELPARPVACACASGVLTSLAANLVQNAIKYMGAAKTRRVVVKASATATSVRVEVEDTGPGLPPELHGRVFEPFVRARASGLPGIGLGLATVKRLAEAHGGQAGTRSRPDDGSIFWFEMPLAESIEADDHEPAGSRRRRAG